jgi:hypothetical protein
MPTTHPESPTRIDEIASGIYRISADRLDSRRK